MRLSEAIRLGATLKPQSSDQWDTRGSCALAAAAEAVGLERRKIIYQGKTLWRIPYSDLESTFPILKTVQASPVRGDEILLLPIVWDLNDIHGWTREQIADWVEQIESQEIEEVRHDVSEVSA